MNDPSGQGVPPVATDWMSSMTIRSERLKNVSNYLVVTTLALQGHSCMKNSVGLTDDEALRLSTRHNKNGHYVHAMTHCDYVSSVIRLTNVFLLMCPT